MAAAGSEASSGAAPLTEADLIFSPQANHNFSRILGDLKKSNLSITNRLRSIKEDAQFVSEAAEALGRPLIANERCGSWYISLDKKAGSAYFKSTDGHMGQWSFSTRRLNLHLLSVIGENDGCIIVDSTRRGKRMPDALSKTIPTWCCVINHALFPETDEHRLFTPPHVVSESEHAQMKARIPDFVEALASLRVDIASLRKQLKKPLRPFWLTQESQIEAMTEIYEDYHPVICLTSSRRVQGGEMSEGGYIQGAGDDTENWALGLTPVVFWQNEKLLLSTPEADLPELVKSLVVSHATANAGSAPKQLTDNLYVGTLEAELPDPTASPCTITVVPQTTEPSDWVKSPTCMEVGLGKQNKLASRNLRTALAQICDFASQYLSSSTSPTAAADILIRCESGKDVSVGIALALLCRLFDDEGKYNPSGTEKTVDINKSVIKVKLGRVMTRFPEATPSRATLQSVNSFLMG
ncbi:initiator tRNA phosphoribosyl transferase [Apiospora arundinis]|uniref:Initiator tRNA phosphoribosyl transferase n=1 Tax=Apiospora arundinis TaxID=335852 RepID=A0ABR2HZH9_9PEZI